MGAHEQASRLISRRAPEQVDRRASAAGRLRVRGHVRLALAALGRGAAAPAGYRGPEADGRGRAAGQLAALPQPVLYGTAPWEGRWPVQAWRCRGVELRDHCPYHSHKGAQL